MTENVLRTVKRPDSHDEEVVLLSALPIDSDTRISKIAKLKANRGPTEPFSSATNTGSRCTNSSRASSASRRRRICDASQMPSRHFEAKIGIANPRKISMRALKSSRCVYAFLSYISIGNMSATRHRHVSELFAIVGDPSATDLLEI